MVPLVTRVYFSTGKQQRAPTSAFYDYLSSAVPSDQQDQTGSPDALQNNSLPETNNKVATTADPDSTDDCGQPSTAEHSIADSTAPPIESEEDSSTDTEESVLPRQQGVRKSTNCFNLLMTKLVTQLK